MMCRASTTHRLKRDVILIRREQWRWMLTDSMWQRTWDSAIWITSFDIISNQKKKNNAHANCICSDSMLQTLHLVWEDGPEEEEMLAEGRAKTGIDRNIPVLSKSSGKKKRSDKTVHFRGDPGSHGRWLTRGGKDCFDKNLSSCMWECSVFTPRPPRWKEEVPSRQRW